MSASIWPPIPPERLAREEQECQDRELAWLLATLRTTLQTLKAGLDEIAALLAAPSSATDSAAADAGGGDTTLALSTHRSESLKGFVTRAGARLRKGELRLRMPALAAHHTPRGAPHFAVAIASRGGPPAASPADAGAPATAADDVEPPPVILTQVVAARERIADCLDVVDVATWGGDSTDPRFIAGQLRLLDVNLQEAKAALKGGTALQLPWYKDAVDETAYTPPLPPNLSLHFHIQDASLVLEARTLELLGPVDLQQQLPPPPPTLSLRDRLGGLALALGGAALRPTPSHDEADDVFTWRGQDARVRDKVRVESADPGLMAALAKLQALDRAVGLARKSLDTLMGQED